MEYGGLRGSSMTFVAKRFVAEVWSQAQDRQERALAARYERCWSSDRER
jgi:hypothetical protein